MTDAKTDATVPGIDPDLLGADALDANSPRLLTGAEYVLLKKSNRMLQAAGVYPLNGLPDHTSGKFTLELLPHSNSVLELELRPRAKAGWPAGEWLLSRHAAGTPDFKGSVSGASPWVLRVPLVGGRPNQVEIHLAGAEANADQLFFIVRDLRIAAQP